MLHSGRPPYMPLNKNEPPVAIHHSHQLVVVSYMPVTGLLHTKAVTNYFCNSEKSSTSLTAGIFVVLPFCCINFPHFVYQIKSALLESTNFFSLKINSNTKTKTYEETSEYQ